MDKETIKTFSQRAKELEDERYSLYSKEVELIVETMKEKKSLFGFDKFDKEELLINDDAYFESDQFEMGKICTYFLPNDVYFIGMEYIETPENKRKPYSINVYYVEEDCATLGVTDLSEVLPESRCLLIDLIRGYA